MSRRPQVVIIRNPDKPQAQSTLASLTATIRRRAEVTGTGVLADAETLAGTHPDRVIVLGGDGSILAVARAMGEHPAPIVGVNFGKLGFLAEFSLGELEQQLDAALNEPAIVSPRMMIEAAIAVNGGQRGRSLAANDCVVHAGPPYRMIELAISVDGDHLTDVSGDGLVVARGRWCSRRSVLTRSPIGRSWSPATRRSRWSPGTSTPGPRWSWMGKCRSPSARETGSPSAGGRTTSSSSATPLSPNGTR